MVRFTQALVFIVLSIIAILLMHQIHIVLAWIAVAHQFLADKLALLIPGDSWVRIARLSLALIIIPLIVALIPAFVYWLFKRHSMPNIMAVIWIIWVILVTIIAR